MAQRDETHIKEVAARRPVLNTRFITGDNCYEQSRGEEGSAPCERIERELREGLGTGHPNDIDE